MFVHLLSCIAVKINKPNNTCIAVHMTSFEIVYSICHATLVSSLIDHRNFVWGLITMYTNKLTILGRNTLLKYIKHLASNHSQVCSILTLNEDTLEHLMPKKHTFSTFLLVRQVLKL